MTRIARNPGSGKAPVNTPASRTPAGGAGKGDGWGGPPRGKGAGPKYGPITAAVRAAKAAMTPEKRAKRKKAKADKAARVEQFNDHLADLALNAAREETQVSATIALLNRIDGLPIATQRNLNTEVTLEQMVTAAAKLRGNSAT